MPLKEGCATDRLLTYVPKYGLANRILELQAALRVATLANRTLLLPQLLPSISFDRLFSTCSLRRHFCVIDLARNPLSNSTGKLDEVAGVSLHGERMSVFQGARVVLRDPPAEWAHKLRRVSTLDVGQFVEQRLHDEPLVLLLSTLHLLREPSSDCSRADVRLHCDHPGVGFWAPPPPHVIHFWRLLTPRATVTKRVRLIKKRFQTENSNVGSVGVHMRYADGSCEDRVAIWWGGKALDPPAPKCGKIPGCTTLDRSCCNFKLVPSDDPKSLRFPPYLYTRIQAYCESQLAQGELLNSLIAREKIGHAFLALDGQRVDLERQLMKNLKSAHVTVHVNPKLSTKVWSSKYSKAGWNATDIEDSLVDMFTLAETDLFVANPASSFSGCVRDIRAARRIRLGTTQMGLPPHDRKSLHAF
ncbi:hypothetical protein AB1Y20_015159 [Prymnesium parvum]|uniref:GDP-fucose protein O-fucosyltransferase 1 n=1 Tax=Prymnesium parvum TaxID=97485 RepID=A0AB34JZB3_PRYPA